MTVRFAISSEPLVGVILNWSVTSLPAGSVTLKPFSAVMLLGYVPAFFSAGSLVSKPETVYSTPSKVNLFVSTPVALCSVPS